MCFTEERHWYLMSHQLLGSALCSSLAFEVKMSISNNFREKKERSKRMESTELLIWRMSDSNWNKWKKKECILFWNRLFLKKNKLYWFWQGGIYHYRASEEKKREREKIRLTGISVLLCDLGASFLFHCSVPRAKFFQKSKRW